MVISPPVSRQQRKGPDLLALLGEVLWSLRKQMIVAGKLEEDLSGLFYSTCDALGVEPGTRGWPSVAGGGTAHPPGLPAPPRPVAWLALVRTARRTDGSVVVALKGRRPFVLKPHLGAVFLALAEDTGTSTDEGVGFKTLDDLARRIAKQTARPCLSSATINKYVARLRKELVHRGVHDGAIQVSRRLGRRLALRKTPPRWSSPTPNPGTD
jgi:hypothetical protein